MGHVVDAVGTTGQVAHRNKIKVGSSPCNIPTYIPDRLKI